MGVLLLFYVFMVVVTIRHILPYYLGFDILLPDAFVFCHNVIMAGCCHNNNI